MTPRHDQFSVESLLGLTALLGETMGQGSATTFWCQQISNFVEQRIIFRHSPPPTLPLSACGISLERYRIYDIYNTPA